VIHTRGYTGQHDRRILARRLRPVTKPCRRRSKFYNPERCYSKAPIPHNAHVMASQGYSDPREGRSSRPRAPGISRHCLITWSCQRTLLDVLRRYDSALWCRWMIHFQRRRRIRGPVSDIHWFEQAVVLANEHDSTSRERLESCHQVRAPTTGLAASRHSTLWSPRTWRSTRPLVPLHMRTSRIAVICIVI